MHLIDFTDSRPILQFIQNVTSYAKSITWLSQVINRKTYIVDSFIRTQLKQFGIEPSGNYHKTSFSYISNCIPNSIYEYCSTVVFPA